MKRYSKWTRYKDVSNDFYTKPAAKLREIIKNSSRKVEREAAADLLKWEAEGRAMRLAREKRQKAKAWWQI